MSRKFNDSTSQNLQTPKSEKKKHIFQKTQIISYWSKRTYKTIFFTQSEVNRCNWKLRASKVHLQLYLESWPTTRSFSSTKMHLQMFQTQNNYKLEARQIIIIIIYHKHTRLKEF